jgi:S-adenosyl-L-methionine hydrolase (adenosine-forming)
MSLLTLLTDFGYTDVYVGVLKGVIAQIQPTLKVIDLTHQIAPQDINAGRFQLMNAYAYFPICTIHVAIVDPGVGGARRSVAVQTAAGTFVAPDNGLLSGVLSHEPAIVAVELTNPDYWWTQTPSTTFHGRDIFAAVGAHLAGGVPIGNFGPAIDPNSLVQIDLPPVTRMDHGFQGCIQGIDHFGNLITNIPSATVQGKAWSVQLPDRQYSSCTSYSEGQPGEIIGLIGSHGYIEIALCGGNAWERLRLKVGSLVRVTITP